MTKQAFLLVFVLFSGCWARETPTQFLPEWESKVTGVRASLRGLDVVNDQVVWASGSHGTVIRTEDGGTSWKRLAVPGAEDLDFRDIEALDNQTAVIASAGQPARIYKTTNGGEDWALLYENLSPTAFFDSIDFWQDGAGLAFSDPVDGEFLLVRTVDGNAWRPVIGLPSPLQGEAGFAASGTSLVVLEGTFAWFATGGSTARVFRSGDRGETWDFSQVPMGGATAASGVFSLAFVDTERGVAAGGNYESPNETRGTAAWTADGGRTWNSPTQPPSGYRSGVSGVPGLAGPVFVAVGPNGCDLSRDGGKNWERFDNAGYHTVKFLGFANGWAAGPEGRVARVRLNSN